MRVTTTMRRTTAVLGTVVLGAAMALASPATAGAAEGGSDGSDAGAAASGTGTTVQILGTNDFHGRIAPDFSSQIAGAAVLAGAVEQLRDDNPNTIFAGAGDFVGASTFPSFVAHDKPTIDAMNAAGLQVSSVGNHEFDQGYKDLTNRIMKPYDAKTNPYGGADWQYLGANVKLKNGKDALPPTWTKTVGGVKVGFVGAVTTHLDELVSPKGISMLNITNIAKATNAAADKLTADGAQIVLLLVHEGYSNTDCKNLTDPDSDLGKVIANLDGNVDAVVSGHTHLAYNCSVPVEQRSQTDDPTLPLPVMQSGKYGANLDQLLFTVDGDGTVTKIEHKLLPLTKGSGDSATGAYPADPKVAAIVKAAEQNAKKLGARSIGEISGPYYRASAADGVTEDRGGESNLGNLIAEAQRWATEDTAFGGAQIALMNPGGLRTDMVGNNKNGYPAELTFKQANDVQPFGNTLVNMGLTGAQLKTVLEEQWQPEGASRPMLHLGASKGFTWTYDPTAKKNHHITQMWLNGKPIEMGKTYSVTVNSFLAAGGDSFFELAKGEHPKDTAQVDAGSFRDFMAANGTKSPLPMDNSQRGVGVAFPANAPKSYAPGDTVKFTLSSLVFPSPKGSDRVHDSKVTVKLGDTTLGTYDVGDLHTSELNDSTGVANVSFTLPKGTDAGAQELTVTGDTTGTTAKVGITVEAAQGSTGGTSGTSGGTSATEPGLAKTGTPAYELVGVAFLLLILGGGLLVAGRRRRSVRV